MSFDYFSKNRVEYILSKLKTIIDKKQDKLTAGDNIVIDSDTNTISASGGDINEIVLNGYTVEPVDGVVDLGDLPIIDDYNSTYISSYSSKYINDLLDTKVDKAVIKFSEDEYIENTVSSMFGY